MSFIRSFFLPVLLILSVLYKSNDKKRLEPQVLLQLLQMTGIAAASKFVLFTLRI